MIYILLGTELGCSIPNFLKFRKLKKKFFYWRSYKKNVPDFLLIFEVLFRGHSGLFLEHSCEMLGIFKAEGICHLCDVAG